MKKNIIVPVSGGKDSLLCFLRAIETGGKVIAIFNDTGWDHPVTYQYLDYLREKLQVEILTTVGGKRGRDLVSLIKDVGRFPFGRQKGTKKCLPLRKGLSV